MALTLGDNFSYQGAKPLDARLVYNTVADMKAVADATMYEGCMAYCKGTDKEYQWKSTNTVDETLGKWREFTSGGGGGSSYTAGDGIDITNDVISTKQSEEGDIDEIIDVYPQAGNLVSIVNTFNRSDIYNTDEKMIGQWTDGKPLYQKTLTGVTGSGDSTIAHNISAIENVIGVNGYVKWVSGSTNMFAPTGFYNGTNRFSVFVDYTNLYIRQTGYDAKDFSVTIQYTKTTDTAISIGSETEYSTDEKVVGTWLDGKPVYQKTIQLPSKVTTTSSGWTTLADVSSLNIGLVIRTDLVDVADNMILTGNLATVVSGSLRVSTVGYTFPCEIVTIQYTKTSS